MTPEQANAHFRPLPERNKWSLKNLPLLKTIAEQIDSGQLSLRKAAKKYNVTKYQVEKWMAYLQKDSKVISRALEPQDLPFIKEVVKEIKAGTLTIPQAAKTYKIYSFEIKKWIRILNKDAPAPDLSTIEISLKKQIIEDVYCGKLSRKAAGRKYNVSPEMIALWISKLPAYRKPTFTDKTQITDQVKVQVVRKIQSGGLTQLR